MATAATLCRGQRGLSAPLVQVEVHLGSGLPVFAIVGLPATAVKESKERVRAALVNCGFEFPAGRIIVNLAPAELPKEGGRFDLPIALGILQASGQVPNGAGGRQEFYGELGLTGELRPVRGLLLAALHAARCGHEIFVPTANLAEVQAARHERAHGVDTLPELCARLHGEGGSRSEGRARGPRPQLRVVAGTRTAQELAPAGVGVPRVAVPGAGGDIAPAGPPPARSGELDLREVRGQYLAKRALLVAAAGGHSVLFCGPPGSGKTMLAQRLPGLLPPLSAAEAMEVACIASVSAAGFDPRSFGERPFRAPHHTASAYALIGGGPHARPGEISLAHRGVLFLDELPEFDRRVLEALREPLESRVVSVSRARVQAQYPAAFQLVAAMNPCPCGRHGDPEGGCTCTPAQVEQYRGRISGPLLDRIDLYVEVERVPVAELMAGSAAAPRLEAARAGVGGYAAAGSAAPGGAVPGCAAPGTTALGSAAPDTACAAMLVQRARDRALRRAGCLNAEAPESRLQAASLTEAAGALLAQAFERLHLTARSYTRVLRVARTVADLEDSEHIEPGHVAEAVQFRRRLGRE
ncbi:MAG TPA: YifB family Mg chelatase-like AAA ATPase [Steroidobacteraceae bacterium]|nr:YifB family Mg chelatase-like AAA ATPase [Steroidobacteraceae bacterium]